MFRWRKKSFEVLPRQRVWEDLAHGCAGAEVWQTALSEIASAEARVYSAHMKANPTPRKTLNSWLTFDSDSKIQRRRIQKAPPTAIASLIEGPLVIGSNIASNSACCLICAIGRIILSPPAPPRRYICSKYCSL